ncbi:MAG: ferritin family protein [Candidatus Omnitrophica bacterium]|nr:ferritin family protein [Candidatus Omnitrophota bacterium]
MGNIFSGSEIVEMGIQIEKNGKAFYDRLTEKSSNGEAKDIFKFLAGEEEKHIVLFKKILEAVGKFQPQETYPGEYYEYMNALAGEYIFTQKGKGQEVAAGVKDDKDAVNLGIGFEKDSIIFYDGLKRVVPEYDQKTVDTLITEEKAHLRKLYGLKRKIG